MFNLGNADFILFPYQVGLDRFQYSVVRMFIFHAQ